MPFDPALPITNSPVASAELRGQFIGLKDLIDDRPTFDDQLGAIQDAISTDTSGNASSIADLSLTVSNPPTQAQVQAIVDKLNELLHALKRV